MHRLAQASEETIDIASSLMNRNIGVAVLCSAHLLDNVHSGVDGQSRTSGCSASNVRGVGPPSDFLYTVSHHEEEQGEE